MSARNRALSRLGQHIAASREQGDRPMDYDAIKAALLEAAKSFRICDGECYETRHGMMNGPCEAMLSQAAASVAAFLRAPDINTELMLSGADGIAAAVERAAREGGDA